MLLIDGVRYELWEPPNEDALEQMVKEHAQDIFGEEAEFFNKQRLESELGKGSVPDGFVVIFSPSSRWYIVETELSFHDVHKHIVEQHSRFIRGIRSSETKNKIVKAIYNEIDKDASRKQKLKKAIEPDEIYRFLHEVISKPPVLTIIVEKPIRGLDETLKALSRDTISDIKVVEFQTFVRKGVGLGAHAHLFEPLYKPAIVNLSQSPSRIMLSTSAFEIILKPAHIKYRYIHIPTAKKDLFPDCAITLELETDIGVIEAGFYTAYWGNGFQKGLFKWFKAHPELKAGGKIVIDVIEPMKRYGLRKA
ncbi:MAG: hypothetical protein MUO97_03165 [Dehalococcoidia bacterium]|nr:hypothetical protein [Dehalococcoidia bacterium]